MATTLRMRSNEGRIAGIILPVNATHLEDIRRGMSYDVDGDAYTELKRLDDRSAVFLFVEGEDQESSLKGVYRLASRLERDLDEDEGVSFVRIYLTISEEVPDVPESALRCLLPGVFISDRDFYSDLDETQVRQLCQAMIEGVPVPHRRGSLPYRESHRQRPIAFALHDPLHQRDDAPITRDPAPYESSPYERRSPVPYDRSGFYERDVMHYDMDPMTYNRESHIYDRDPVDRESVVYSREPSMIDRDLTGYLPRDRRSGGYYSRSVVPRRTSDRWRSDPRDHPVLAQPHSETTERTIAWVDASSQTEEDRRLLELTNKDIEQTAEIERLKGALNEKNATIREFEHEIRRVRTLLLTRFHEASFGTDDEASGNPVIETPSQSMPHPNESPPNTPRSHYNEEPIPIQTIPTSPRPPPVTSLPTTPRGQLPPMTNPLGLPNGLQQMTTFQELPRGLGPLSAAPEVTASSIPSPIPPVRINPLPMPAPMPSQMVAPVQDQSRFPQYMQPPYRPFPGPAPMWGPPPYVLPTPVTAPIQPMMFPPPMPMSPQQPGPLAVIGGMIANHPASSV